MGADELSAERGRGLVAGAAAIVAVLLIVIGAIWSSSIDQDDTGGKPAITQRGVTQAPQERGSNSNSGNKRQSKGAPAEKREQDEQRKKAREELEDDRDEVNGLASIDNNADVFMGTALISALALVLLLLPALHLYRATKARDPGEAPIVGFLAVYGPIALGLGTVIRAFAFQDASADFVGQQFASYAVAADEARDLQTGGLFIFFQALTLSGLLALAFWLIKGVWDAAKIGLLPKPYAVLGMALPLLTLIATPLALPIGAFWMLAFGLLLLRRWPGGVPPAWEAGRSIPWPPRGQSPEQDRQELGGERNGDVKVVGPGVGGDGDGPPKKRKRRS